MIVHINPLERTKLPKTAPEIFDRMNEITFNSSLMREMRAIAFVTRLIDEGGSTRSTSACSCTAISDDDEMAQLGACSKLNPEWDFLCKLRDTGRQRADEWLELNFDRVGRDSSIDLAEIYL